MIDMHNHIVYGVDDGARDFEESIKMISLAVEDGITKIISTPHYIHGANEYDEFLYNSNFDMVVDYINDNQLPIALFKGNELFLDELSINDLFENKCKTLNNSRYVLVEWQYNLSLNTVKQLIYSLLIKQYVPIIAHAERLIYERKDIDKVNELYDMNALIQINAKSIIDPKDRNKRKFINTYLKQKKIHFIASDAHDYRIRKPELKRAQKLLLKRYDDTYIEDLFYNNQLKVIENKII